MKQRFHALPDRMKGMLAVLTGFASFAICDVFQKKMSAIYPSMHLGTYGMLFCIAFFLLFMAACGQLKQFGHIRGKRIYTMRAACLCVQYMCFLTAIASLPLATLYTMAFTMPLIITVLGMLFLHEKPSRGTSVVLVIGFLGVVIALRPGDWQISLAMLAAIGNGVLMAFSNLAVRYFPKDDHWMIKSSVPIMIELALFACIALIVGTDMAPPAIEHIPHFLAIGFFMSIGLAMLPYSFSKAPVAVIAPFQYTALIWGTLYGWLFFGHVIDIWTLAGAALIICAGLWLLLHRPQISPKTDG